MRSIGQVVSAIALTAALLVASEVAARPQSGDPAVEGGAAKARLLDVPYVPQSEALCGGAAVAMVLRYWGDVPVHADDFAALVDDSAEGIRLGELMRAVRNRGWQALPFTGAPPDVQGHLADGRPVIALIEDRPGRYHYVVVVAWTPEQIVFHDPARGPFRLIDHEKFERAWARTGRTALLILPPSDTVAVRASDHGSRDEGPPECVEPVREAVRLARSGDLDAAEALLSFAGEMCPRFSGAPRELAGIRFEQEHWTEAADLAEQAVARDRSDMHAWQLLASARFLLGEQDEALRAWNQRDEPRVDLARIEGLDRTRHQVVAHLLDLSPQSLLTESRLKRAKRRIAALPAVQVSRVSYSPAASGRASVDVTVLERPVLPKTWPTLTATGLQAATAREARVDVASPSGSGELWTASWRWWARRPRVSFSIAAPQVWRWTGLWRLDGGWERQTYQALPRVTDGISAGNPHIESERRYVGLRFGDWRSGDFRWEAGAGLDRWNKRGDYISVGAILERRLVEDRLALRAGSAIWAPRGRAAGFGSAEISSAWRSGSEGPAFWTVRAGLSAVSARAPSDLWPAPDTGQARAPLLRAHPLLEDGVIRVSALGRILAHGTLEFQSRLTTRSLARLRWAVFVDVAKQGHAAIRRPAQIDLGGGLRAELPGAPGVLRLDVARGVRDDRVALSAAWQSPWPGW